MSYINASNHADPASHMMTSHLLDRFSEASDFRHPVPSALSASCSGGAPDGPGFARLTVLVEARVPAWTPDEASARLIAPRLAIAFFTNFLSRFWLKLRP